MRHSLKALVLCSVCVSSGLAACVPDIPEVLLHDPAILQHPVVVAAFDEVDRNLSALFVNTTRDGLSFAIVHASSPALAFSFNHGVLKMNETTLNETSNQVTSDSIFRIASVSKNFATFSAIVAENKGRALAVDLEITLDTPVRYLLPEFRVPEVDWKNGGSEITLSMLASHTSGLTREAYFTPFNMVTATGKADARTIGAAWASVTPEMVLEHFNKTSLMFAPRQSAGYSNAGISLLASAVTAYYNNATQSKMSWPQFVSKEVFAPLNMTHSFFGAIPLDLIADIGVPGGENWADLIVGLGYDPAAGMWSSANDVAKYLYHIWLRPDPPQGLITLSQRRRTLKPSIALPDGKQLTGPGWEIDLYRSTASNTTVVLDKTYAVYGKSGDAGGWHAWIDTVPNLGYGVVVMSQESGTADYARIVPTSVRDSVHDILIPAFATALSDRMYERFGGWYADGSDSGLISDEIHSGNYSNSTTYAKIEVKEQILYLRTLVVNGTNALEGLDKLGWTEESGPRYWSTEKGVALVPSEGSGEKEEFGEGVQVWRWLLPALEVCDWFDFDGYTDYNGWPLAKMVLVEKDGGVELHYPPFDVVLGRTKPSGRT